jgi:hypothetical protein
VIEDKEVTDSQIQKVLESKGRIKLKNVQVKDRLVLPRTFDLFVAENVVFEAGMEGGRSELTPEDEPASGRLQVADTKFLGPVDFTGGKYLDVKMEDSIFQEDAIFHSLVTDCFWLTHSTFQGQVIFSNLDVRFLQLTDVKFNNVADFGGAVIDDFDAVRIRTEKPILIEWEQFGEKWFRSNLDWAVETDEEYEELSAAFPEFKKLHPELGLPETYVRLSEGAERSRLKQIEVELGFWKRNFEELGLHADARHANYRINELRRTYFSSFPAKSTIWVLEKPNGFGTNPYRPLVYSTVIILAFWLLFLRRDPFIEKETPEIPRRPKRPLVIFALLYSIELFIPVVTVTGVENWGWVIAPNYRWAELTERLMGLVLTSLAAFSLSEYFF